MRQSFLAALVAAAVSLLTVVLMLPFNGSAVQNSLGLATTGVFNGLTEQNSINNALDALLTCNSGSSAPTNSLSGVPEEGQCWLDTTSSTMKIKKRYSGSGWVVEGIIDVTNGIWIPAAGGGTGTVASATPDLCTSPQQLQTVSGTTTITSFGSSCVVGTRRTLLFSGIVPITYNSSSMILPGQVSYTTAANDVLEAIYLGSGNWRVTAINRINGQAVVNPSVEPCTMHNYMGATAPAKYVYGFGQALTRASFPDFLACATRTQTGTATSGNATLTAVGDTSKMGAGMPIEGTCFPAGTTISSVTGSTIVASANATTNGSCSVTVFLTGYGAGGSASTIGVPDCRDAVIAGRGDMGGTDRGLLTASANGFNGNAKALNVFGGGESVTMAAGNLIAHTHANTLTDPGHTHVENIPESGGGSAFNNANGAANSSASYQPLSTASALAGITINNASAGSASPTPMRTVPPTLIADCIVRVIAMIGWPANDNAPIARGREPFAIARRLA